MTTHYVLALDTSGVQSWLADNAIPLVLIVIGLSMLAASHKQDTAKIVTTLVGVVISLGALALALIPGAAKATAVTIGHLLNLGS
ncbi:hypothetical protein [Pseudonocardia sp. D17]|jgi:hypothetical protein|uniref:hypothetical protein n=1 Tax=Pseudonocardia sp. D17 TaxID=882661 RepID=UPI002B368805|nr:hypothetical protein PSD17_02850 [Pseudonocardia sp. D17]